MDTTYFRELVAGKYNNTLIIIVLGAILKDVIDDPDSWIIGDNSSSNHKYDNNRTEYQLTYDVAISIKKNLKEKGYDSIITRKSRDITSTTGHALAVRIDMANEKKADYFISLHADGANKFAKGAHAIHSSTDNIEESKELSTDIMKYYNVVELHNSPKKDIRGLRVLRTSNKAIRKTLIELGFVTTPKEAKAMFSNINLIGSQLAKGLIENIDKNF